MLNELLASIHQQARGIKTGPQKPLLAPSAHQVRSSKLPLQVAILQMLWCGGRLLVTRDVTVPSSAASNPQTSKVILHHGTRCWYPGPDPELEVALTDLKE